MKSKDKQNKTESEQRMEGSNMNKDEKTVKSVITDTVGTDNSTDGQMVMEFDPIAERLPLIEGKEFDDLVRDIKQNGLLEPIWTYKGRILDGRNRYRACLQAGIHPTYRNWEGKGNPITFVMSANVHRRHLTTSQRAMIAAELTTLEEGQNPDRQICRPPTQEEAALMFKVSTRSVGAAVNVRKKSVAEAIADIRDGYLTMEEAKKIADLPHNEQKAILAERKEGLAKTGIRKKLDIKIVPSPTVPVKKKPLNLNAKEVSEVGQYLMMAFKLAEKNGLKDLQAKIRQARTILKGYEK